jgi:hypothetical protein
MNIDAMAAFFAKLGFPVAVAAWLLYRVDSLMQQFISAQIAVADNSAKIAVLLDQLLKLHQR